MPLSKIQIDVLRLLAAHRDPESYVAGATPLNRDAPRYSSDIDVFHDRQERVASAALSDAQALGVAGYAVRWLRQLPQMYTAEDRPIRVGRKSRQRCLGLDRNIALQFRPAVEVDITRSERRLAMDFETYKSSLAEEAPPEGLSMAAQALWWEAKGDWHLAHQCAQKQADAEGAWAHAYLHRVEGDLHNAGGWYNRAGRPASTAPLKEEWETIARALLG